MNAKKPIILIIIAGFFISLGTNLGLLYVRRDAWLPPPSDETALPEAEPEPAPNSRQDWDLQTSQLLDLAQELEEKEARLVKESETLMLMRARLDSERADIDRLRTEIEAQFAEVERVFTRFTEAERRNVRSLSKIYTEMAPDAVSLLFREIDEALAVKILSQLPQENAGGILEAMTRMGGQDALRAARLTGKMRTLVTESTP